ncbi:MAG: outer membrane beta-barrel protein [Alphaproteobacteria bacterium]|nr:outer membrane beta-barrel protein [Alphaproteobacteria bacterium]
MPKPGSAVEHLAVDAPVSGATLDEALATTTAAAPAARRDAVGAAVNEAVGRVAQADPRALPVTPPVVGAAPPSDRGPETGAGIRLGSFIVYPDIQSGVFWDSNIYATRNNRKSDIVGVLSPSVTVQSGWERHSLSAGAQIDFTGYRRYTDESTIDWRANLEGRVDITNTMQVYLGAIVLEDHEERSSPDAVAGTKPTRYREVNSYAGISERFGDVVVRLGGAVERIMFENSTTPVGIINNADRDRNRFTFGALVRYQGFTNFEPYLEAIGDIRHYDNDRDDFTFQRSSRGFRAGGGVRMVLSETLRGDVTVGVMRQDYKDPRFKDIAAPFIAGTLRWTATPSTQLVAYVDRSIEETTLPGSPGYVYSVVGMRIEQGIVDNVTGIARAAVARSDFVGFARTDDELDLSAGLRYRINSNFTVGADCRFIQRDSNVANADYNRHQMFLRLGAQF